MILPYYECRPKLVPEDSVRPETQTLIIINRRKGFVGSFYKVMIAQKERVIYIES